jgi:hypothetical protein
VSYLHHQYWPLNPTIPAKRPASNPLVTAWPVVAGHLHRVKVMIPAGHNGNTGFRITYQGQQIIPWGNNSWLTWDGDVLDLDWDQEVMASGLAFAAWNTDRSAHQFFAYADITPDLDYDSGGLGGQQVPAAPSADVLTAIGTLAG